MTLGLTRISTCVLPSSPVNKSKAFDRHAKRWQTVTVGAVAVVMTSYPAPGWFLTDHLQDRCYMIIGHILSKK